jgi:methylthioribose-1-phosphate isomerase
MVIVGADRVAMNGDVANKIGTYGLAVLARHHGVPFYVALPRSTFDPGARTGADIPIEERSDGEIRELPPRRLVPEDAQVWNPAFDLTPEHLVTAFITDAGILRPPFSVSIRRALAGSGADRGHPTRKPDSTLSGESAIQIKEPPA